MTVYKRSSAWERMTQGSLYRCDGRGCGKGLRPGASAWVTRHIALNPTEAHTSYAVLLCEDCRVRQIAQGWAADGEVPPFELRPGTSNERGLAGGVDLDRRQYGLASALATRLLDDATAPDSTDAEPVEVPAERDAIRREQRRAARRATTTA